MIIRILALIIVVICTLAYPFVMSARLVIQWLYPFYFRVYCYLYPVREARGAVLEALKNFDREIMQLLVNNCVDDLVKDLRGCLGRPVSLPPLLYPHVKKGLLQVIYSLAPRLRDDHLRGDNTLTEAVERVFNNGPSASSTILGVGFNYLILSPTLQGHLAAEIKRVIGRRSPQLSDRARMPYLEAFVHEVLRKVALDHTALRASRLTPVDLEYHGERVPKGTLIVLDLPEIMNDPELWDRPEIFNPNRFLTSRGEFRNQEHWIPFGLGYQKCPAEDLAQSVIFLFLVGLLQKFTFSQLPNQNSRVIDPEYQVIITQRTF